MCIFGYKLVVNPQIFSFLLLFFLWLILSDSEIFVSEVHWGPSSGRGLESETGRIDERHNAEIHLGVGVGITTGATNIIVDLYAQIVVAIESLRMARWLASCH